MSSSSESSKCNAVGVQEVTDNALGLLKIARSKVRIYLSRFIGAVRSYVTQPDNRQLELLHKAKRELEVNWETYKKAHSEVEAKCSTSFVDVSLILFTII